MVEKIFTDSYEILDEILELNPNHPVFAKIEEYYNTDEVLANKYVKLLYNQALLIEGFNIEKPVEFSQLMCELMIKSVNK